MSDVVVPLRRPRWVGSIACVAVFLVAFFGAAAAIRALLPFPPVPVVETKIRYLRSHVNEYDTLFVGSSRVFHQFLPEMFDELMAKQGHTVRSFNAGIDGMQTPEDSYYLDLILSFRPTKLKWVFLELQSMRTSVGEDKKGTIRLQYWHDWERIKWMWRRAVLPKSTKKRKWKRR